MVEADALRMDFSRQDIVWDDAYREVLAVLRTARDEAVKEICGWRRFGIPGGWATALIKRVTARLTPEGLCSDEEDSLGATVARAELWTTISKEQVSLTWLRGKAGEQGTVGITYEDVGVPGDPQLNPEALAGGQPVLRLQAVEEETCLRRLFGDQIQIVTSILRTRREAIENHRRFRRRQMQVALPEGTDYLAARPLSSEGLEGIMGLRPDQKPSRLTLVWQGCLLVQINGERSLPGLEMVVAAAFTPDDAFTNVVPDAVYGQAIGVVLEGLEALYTAAAAKANAMSTPLRRQLLAFLEDSVVPGFSDRFLDAWGATAWAPDPPQVQVCLGVGRHAPPAGSLAPHPLASVPLISDVNGRWWSLRELAEHQDNSGACPG